jgi:hypothetical protein
MLTTERRRFLASLIGVLSSSRLAGRQRDTPPYVPKQNDRPEALGGDEPGFRGIRRPDPVRLGGRSPANRQVNRIPVGAKRLPGVTLSGTATLR